MASFSERPGPERPGRGDARVRRPVLVGLLVGLQFVVQLVLLGALLALPSAASADSPYWLPPLGTPLEVSGPYRPPPTPYASGHRGIDLPAAPGELVHAPVGGVVSFVGQVADRHVLSVRVDSRTVVSFEPIEQADAALTEGAQVLPRQPLGIVAEGGHCLDECLHLGVRVDDEYVNPLRYFLGKPVLLPW